jgi:aquaporin Z|tara:strand:- start:12541 stop:13257 length:717 start_codon:yes stop_codon:yes gene_type:complete
MNRFDIVNKAEGDEESATLLSTVRPTRTQHSVYQQMACETVGVLFLTATIAMKADALGIGAMLAVMIFALGHISGAHLNPAVTLAVAIRGKIGWLRAALYMVAQVAGAFLGGLVPMLVLDDVGDKIAFPKRGDDVGVLAALTVETVFTLALALVVLNVATSKAQEGNSFFGLAIGFTVLAAAKANAGISGACFNPAVGVSLPVLREHYDDIWIYCVGPLLGGALAGGLFMLTARGDEF